MSNFLRTIFGALLAVILISDIDSVFAASTKEARVKLLVDNADMDFWTSNSAGFATLLGKFHTPSVLPADHRAWMDAILPGGASSIPHDKFRGLGGIPAYQAWDLADETIGTGNEYDNRIAGEVVFGRIEDFNYNAADGSGSMKVIQVYTSALGRNGRGGGLAKKSRVVAYRYTVSVAANGFIVDIKNLLDPTNVFPNAFAATGIRISAEKAANFNSKLYATGTSISVTNVEKAKKYNKLGDPTTVDWTAPLNQKEAKAAAAIMTTDSTSCIDMMFAASPPSSLPDGARPPFYCLGRCGSPMLINTM